MSRSVRNRVVMMLVLLAALASLGLPAAAQESVATGGEAATSATETVSVTNLPVAGHGEREPSDAGALALRHTIMTVVVLLAAAAMALGGIGVLWRYERR